MHIYYVYRVQSIVNYLNSPTWTRKSHQPRINPNHI